MTMGPEASTDRWDGAAAHPLAELLACPAAVADLLNASAECVQFDVGDTVFRQSSECRGLWVVVAGTLQRKAERMEARVMLGSVRAGELVELAAVLGEGQHTYTLMANSPGSVVLLPIEVLRRAFQAYPPLRMQLLEELAREVSRAYTMCCVIRLAGIRRRSIGA
jgi:CRP-like cAMP-binding protein